MSYPLSRPRLLAFVVACVVWLLALGMGQADDPDTDVWTPATAPDVSAVPYVPAQENDGGDQ